MIIPQPLALFVPWLAGALATWLVSAKLTQFFNGLIITAAFLLSLVLCILTSGKLTGDMTANLTLIIGYSAAVFGLMKPLMDFLSDKIPSPLAALAPARIVDAVPTPVPVPASQRTITFPSGNQFAIPGAPTPGTPNATPPPTNG